MISRKSGLLFGLLALLTFGGSSTESVRAQDPLGLGFGLLYGYGASNTPTIRSFIPAPPYFSLHPPVYYGKRYSRPYGESPFASWPQLRSPDNYMPQPAAKYVAPMVINLPGYAPAQLYPAPSVPVAPPAPVAPQPNQAVDVPSPVVIHNPYYLEAVSRAQLVGQP